MDSRKTQNDDKQKKQWTVARHRTMTDKNKPMNSHKTHNDDRQKKQIGQSQDTER